MENKLHELLMRQSLILKAADTKLQIVRYMKWHYELDNDMMNSNLFLQLTLHIYHRNAIIDLAALYGKPRSNKYNLNQITKNEDYSKLLKDDNVKIMRSLLDNNLTVIDRLITMRDTEVAHYDLVSNIPEIKYDFTEIDMVFNLWNLAKEIVSKASQSFNNDEHNIGLNFGGKSIYLDSLTQIIPSKL